MTARAALLMAALALPAASQGPVPDAPQLSPREEGRSFEEVRDRILSSLFFRGEVADLIIEAGISGQFVVTEENEPYSEVREKMLAWIRLDPDQAAKIYLYLKKGRDTSAEKGYTYKEYSFEISPHFVGLVKALSAAAADGAASDEDLSAAGRRLFAGIAIEPDGSSGAGAGAGPAMGGPSDDGSSLINADFKLDKKALSASARRLGAWADSARKDLELARGPRADRRAGLVGKAFAEYRGLLGAASSVSGRDRITAAEAARLEKLRQSVRGSLSASSLLAAADDLDSLADLMERRGRPGSASRARAAARELDGAGARIESGSARAAEIGRLISEGERVYLAASFGTRAALLLANMAETAARPDLSCLYDFLSDRYFRRAAPGSAYARARRLLGLIGAAAPGAAALAEKGDFDGAFEKLSSASGAGKGPDAAAAEFGEALKLAAAVSRANARAQYLTAGVALNPLGLEFGPRGFRLAGLFPASR